MIGIDIETGGLWDRDYGITQLGASHIDESGLVLAELRVFIRLSPNLAYSGKALTIQRSSVAEIEAKGVPEQQALAQLSSFLYDRRDVPVWAHNAQFETKFLNQGAKRCADLRLAWPIFGCTFCAAADQCHRRIMPIHDLSLAGCLRAHGIPFDPDLLHTPDYDARMAALLALAQDHKYRNFC